jgi:phosphatidylinositol alpha-1,6-mannosyltransferase
VFVHGLELTNAGTGLRAQVLKNAWRLLANSNHTAERVAALLPETKSRIRVVPLCVEPDRVDEWKSQGALSSEVGRRPAAMIVGRMWSEQPGKGHDALIEAMPEVLEVLPEAELWIVGQGDDSDRLSRKAEELGIAEAVIFHGRVSDEELSRLYQSASVFAMPSQQEGFGLVYLEAMWHGLPCIGSTADAARHVIPTHAGRLVTYDDARETAKALKELLANPAETRSFGLAAREWVEERYSYDRFKRQLLESLELG